MTAAVQSKTPQAVAGTILNIFAQHPEVHRQSSWGSANECGSTACVAGMAALLTGRAEFVKYDDDGTMAELTIVGDDRANGKFFSEIGREELGLNYQDAEVLFLHTNESQAIDALKYVAEGKSIDWQAIKGEDFDPNDVA